MNLRVVWKDGSKQDITVTPPVDFEERPDGVYLFDANGIIHIFSLDGCYTGWQRYYDT